jgi:5-methylcytosine-specific restriction endonuclease McrA
MRRIPLTAEQRAERRRFWLELRERVLKRDNYRCRECFRERPSVQLQVHHKVEKRKGGTDEMSNLETLCTGCHAGHHHWILKYGYNTAKKIDKIIERKQLKSMLRHGVRVE